MKIGIIGGGAAGLMAAATICETNPSTEIFLIERNDGLGKKVIISGGGRCNVTTGIRDIRTVLTKYPRGGKFLTSAMHAFSPEDVFDWFEAHGVPLKVEEDLRVFPRSDNGKDIVRVFEHIFDASKVHVLLKTAVVRVEKADDGFNVFLKDQEAPLFVNKLVLTTGGQAYRQTGSTGDGYAFAQSLGHTITKLAPSLSAFVTKETWPSAISGLSFENATVSSPRDKKFSYTGPFLFTHKGISGPAVFALSGLVAFERFDETNPLDVAIDVFPHLTDEELRTKIENAIADNKKKSVLNVFATGVPKALAEILFRELAITVEKHAGELSKKDIERCIAWLKGIPLHVVGRNAGEEFVTAGGVNLKEVDPKMMGSKITQGLYFAGEILDIDGFTGGFNLQASWAAGHLVGTSLS